MMADCRRIIVPLSLSLSVSLSLNLQAYAISYYNMQYGVEEEKRRRECLIKVCVISVRLVVWWKRTDVTV